MTTIGFVGLGKMGGPMCGRLIDAGHSLVVHDVAAGAVAAAVARGAIAAGSAKAVADAADIVFVSLPTPAIVEQAVTGPGGLADGTRAGIFVDVSTTGPMTSKRIAEALRTAGKAWVECPVSGGVRGATNGTLALMVAAPKAAFETVTPLLEVFGRVFFVGEAPGLAQVVKLGNNMMAAAAIVVTAEALAMGVKAGVDPKVMLDIVNVSTGRNTASDDKFPRSVLTGTFAHGFATGLSYKDVKMCVDEAEAMGVPMVAGALVRQILAITASRFGAESDFTSIARVIEEWAGVEIRSRPPA